MILSRVAGAMVGYRRRPSNTVIRILYTLYELGSAPTFIVARRVGRESNYVSSYLVQLRKRGLVEYVDGEWRLTGAGRELVEKLLKSGV